ncbi:DUF3781 domain-containing protein [Prolixibacteraceae bacterium JC049]|nr:DUF3781 domain-containing protein [Prolixibacteraceae bacterium JC049]
MTKQQIIDNICYTDLVFGRINKKLNTCYSKEFIQTFIPDILRATPEELIVKSGKNYYVSNNDNNIRITINSNNYRVITVDKIDKKCVSLSNYKPHK